MSGMWLAGLGVAAWSGFLALERRAFLQAMFAQPLVAASATGLLLNDLHAGLFVGIVFELLFLGEASLGGSMKEHETLPAIAATTAAAIWAHAAGSPSLPAHWSLAILLCAPLGALGRYVERRMDDRAVRYEMRAMQWAHDGHVRKAVRQNLRAMWPHFTVFALLAGLVFLLAGMIAPWIERLPLIAMRGLAWVYGALGCGAAGVAVGTSRSKHAVWWAILAGAAVALWSFVAEPGTPSR